MSPFLRNVLKAPVFPNTGSVARDHLAWVRTGLGFMALGIAVDRFNQLDVSALVTTFKSGTTTPPSVPAPEDISKAKNIRTSVAETDSTPRSLGSLQDSAAAGGIKQHDPLARDQILVAALMGTSIGSITYGPTRYMSNFRLLQQGRFKAAYAGPAVFSFVVSGIAAASFAGRHEFERRREV